MYMYRGDNICICTGETIYVYVQGRQYMYMYRGDNICICTGETIYVYVQGRQYMSMYRGDNIYTEKVDVHMYNLFHIYYCNLSSFKRLFY